MMLIKKDKKWRCLWHELFGWWFLENKQIYYTTFNNLQVTRQGIPENLSEFGCEVTFLEETLLNVGNKKS